MRQDSASPSGHAAARPESDFRAACRVASTTLLAPRPETVLTLPEKFAGLFDSRRDYMDQLQHYKTAASSDSQND